MRHTRWRNRSTKATNAGPSEPSRAASAAKASSVCCKTSKTASTRARPVLAVARDDSCPHDVSSRRGRAQSQERKLDSFRRAATLSRPRRCSSPGPSAPNRIIGGARGSRRVRPGRKGRNTAARLAWPHEVDAAPTGICRIYRPASGLRRTKRCAATRPQLDASSLSRRARSRLARSRNEKEIRRSEPGG